MTTTNQVKYLKYYTIANFSVANLALEFDIQEHSVLVKSTAKYIKNPHAASNTLELSGSATLVEVLLNNQPITAYRLENDLLIIANLPNEFTLTVHTNVDAFNNKSCMGLYASNGNLFTQNEPEGFRKITYYLDRSDVLTKFTTTIIGDKTKYPIMLSNGNKVFEEILDNNRHRIIWEDPFNKPSYLFALVAGDFAVLQDEFKTKSGRDILLEVYSEADSIEQCGHAMESLKRSMKWDEDRFNLEYDLDRYMIVASGDFNMGAMENKGLNIFNTKYVLADSKTATDTDFINVEAVVGHEYFHNWTGNRVTCRDWFQLSLKEGLTVFRDHEFTADMHSREVKRIQDVRVLRQSQFAEDSSALAHPVRPESFIEINNFYTVTIYEKGAEVVRMYQTILGKDGFNKGIELYISRHDSQAATCDDFCNAMAAANNFNLDQFMLWYSQAGTPLLKTQDSYDEVTQIYTLQIIQQLPETPDKVIKQPMLIPVAFGLLDDNGNELEFNSLEGDVIKPDDNSIMLVNKQTNIFKFNVSVKPTPSLLRKFSAPVNLDYSYSNEQIFNLAAHDSDSFNRWEALQVIYKQQIMAIYHDASNTVSIDLIGALKKTLTDKSIDKSMLSMLVSLPSFAEISAQYKPINAHQLVNALISFKHQLANNLEATWLQIYQDNQIEFYDFNDAGSRALKNTALSYLLYSTNAAVYQDICEMQFVQADNMTDKIGALAAINDTDLNELRSQLFDLFIQEYSDYPLVTDKWFMLQAQSLCNDAYDNVIKLVNHTAFDKQNPNKLYSLIRAFATNMKSFNTLVGYQFIADEILRIDKFNTGVAGRIASCFSVLTSLTKDYQQIAKPVLALILAEKKLSKDVYEVISKINAQL